MAFTAREELANNIDFTETTESLIQSLTVTTTPLNQQELTYQIPDTTKLTTSKLRCNAQ